MQLNTLPKAVLFDLDDTLAESFQKPTPEIIESFETLLSYVSLAIVSAATKERILERFISCLSPSADIERLFLFPDSGAEGYRYENNHWQKMYYHTFSPEKRNDILLALDHILAAEGWNTLPIRGERIISRDSQITVAALGIEATQDEKKTFDPERTKRSRVRTALLALFPDLEITIGGSTSIDISPQGIDKSHAVRALARLLSCKPGDMLFIGDSFHVGGNDRAVIPTGIAFQEVKSPHDTQVLIDTLIRVHTS